MSRTSRLALGILALLALAAPAAAQSVRGALADPDGRAPVAGALVVLLDASGRTRAEVLTDEGGRFLLHAPAPGRYTLRADRIGHASTRSAALELAAGATVEVRLAAPTEPVRLDAVEVSAAARRCTVRPEGAETALLWDEARKALQSQAATRRQAPYRFQVRRSFRELDPRTETVISEEIRTADGFTETPFVSLSVDDLATHGYVRMLGDTAVFHAPDAEVLLSDAFLDAHCFRVQPGGRDHAGMIGLGFEPVRGSARVDVHGVLWLDQATAELRLLEYGYRNLPRSVPADLAGGRVRFQRLPNGAWIIPAWRIRMPRQAGERINPRRMAIPGVAAPEGVQVALSEEAGEVVAIRTASGERVAATAFASVSGTVFDSVAAAPLAGARVVIGGTSHAAETDAAGRFRIDGVSEGVYSLTFSHPRLDSLAYAPPPVRVRLVPPQERAQDLAIPSLAAIRTAACPAPAEGNASLAGRLANPAGEPLAGARVTAIWQAAGASGDTARAMALSDAAGVYRLCSLPVGPALRLEARLGADTVSDEVRLEHGGPTGRDLTLAAAAAAPGAPAGAGSGSRVMGRLVDAENGRPLVGATVRFTRGLPEQRTDRRGSFVLPDVPEGTYGMEIHHEGYGAATSQVSVRAGAPVAFELRLPRRTVTLEAVTVVAERVRPTDFVRARRRAANFIDRAQIERRPAAHHVGDMLRTVPGLNVYEVPYPGMPGSIAEVCVSARGSTGGTRSLEDEASTGGMIMPLNVSSKCRGIPVLYDDVLISSGVGDFLRQISLAQIETIEYVGPADTAGLYPVTDGGGGLLIIYTRGYAPRALR